MIALIALFACSETPEDTSPELQDTAPEVVDTGDTGDTDPQEAPPTLAEALDGPVHGYLLYYSAELDAYPDQDGWIQSPSLWTFGPGDDLVAYVWNEDPADGGYQIDSYRGTATVAGSVLTLAIVSNTTGEPEFGMAITPEIDPATWDVTWAWTLRDGTAGVITLNPTWDTGYGIDE